LRNAYGTRNTRISEDVYCLEGLGWFGLLAFMKAFPLGHVAELSLLLYHLQLDLPQLALWIIQLIAIADELATALELDLKGVASCFQREAAKCACSTSCCYAWSEGGSSFYALKL